MGAADRIAGLLGSGVPVVWLPLAVFITGALMAFATDSSWGTMGLLMPLALPAMLAAGEAAGVPAGDLQMLAPAVIGSVFGGAVFGDHCSPFSDTTIVSALACGCRPVDHVLSQLPFAGLAAAAACGAYAVSALGVASGAATGLGGLVLAAVVFQLARLQRGRVPGRG